MKFISLYVDESGFANPKVLNSPCYILCGCLVNESSREALRIKADQIKFKYWGRTNIVLHSREIARKENDFSILKDPKVFRSFKKDLINFLSMGGYQIFIVVVDKQDARTRNWNEVKVYNETADIMVKNLVLSLLATENCRGRLVIESATGQKDFTFHKAASHYLAHGIAETNTSYDEVREVLTEITFVTKKNYDIEEQIADLLAYGAKLKFLKKRPKDMDDYELRILEVLNNRLFKMHPNTGKKKKKFHSKIESFKVIP
jgi:hypothetical protein